MDAPEMTVQDYIDILRRRKWSLVAPAFVIFIVSVATALMLPSIYKSTATILIEEQDVPSDFVMATVTSYADQRIQAINQRIMSSSRLLEIIQRFNLYADQRQKKSIDEIVGQMRKDVRLEPISAEVMDRRTGRATAAMIAFNLSFEGKESPETVARVTNVLTSLFLQENIKVRERQTEETSQFLEDEMRRIKVNLEETEKEIALFKGSHINELPELLNVNQQSYYNVEREIGMLEEKLRSLKEKESALQTQLFSVNPYLEAEMADKQRLQELKLQLGALQSRVSDKYPDVIKLKAEIAQLEKRRTESDDRLEESPDNPAYITLSAQLSSTQVEIHSTEQQLNDLKSRRELYQRRIESTPKVEEEYKTLLSRRNSMQAKFDDLMRKHMEARVALGLEREQKGERFTLIDPPRTPEKPYKPNRLAIVLIGVIMGIGAGIGTAALFEFMDDSVRSAETLSAQTFVPTLAVIPEILTDKDISRARIKRAAIMIAGFLATGLAVAGFHFFIMDLNVFWVKLVRRFSLFV